MGLRTMKRTIVGLLLQILLLQPENFFTFHYWQKNHHPITVAALRFKAPNDTSTITLERLDAFVDYATEYLVRVTHNETQDPGFHGRVTYVAQLDEPLQMDEFDIRPQDDYNLLRHNGAIYAMGLSYQRSPSPEVLKAMIRAIDFLKDHAIHAVPDVSAEVDLNEEAEDAGDGGQRKHAKRNKNKPLEEYDNFYPDMLAAWETEDIVPGTKQPIAKLGGAGLALIALCSLELLDAGHTDLLYLRKLGNFIHFLQHEQDGSFTCRYKPAYPGGRDDSWVSLYYPGEAALGLIYLATLEDESSDGDSLHRDKWLETATRALLYLEELRRYQALDEVEPDHWALLATVKLLPWLRSDSREYWLIYEHALKVARSMLALHTKTELKQNYGCFSFDRRTCPTATRLEGLLAALHFIEEHERLIPMTAPTSNHQLLLQNRHRQYEDSEYAEDNVVEPLRDRLVHDVEWGVLFMLDSQETSDKFKMRGGVPLRFPFADWDKATWKRDQEVRVDYVQHSMCALIAYEDYLLTSRKGGLGQQMLRRFHKHQSRKALTGSKATHNGDGGEAGAVNWLLVGFVALIVGLVLLGIQQTAPSLLRRHRKVRVH